MFFSSVESTVNTSLSGDSNKLSHCLPLGGDILLLQSKRAEACENTFVTETFLVLYDTILHSTIPASHDLLSHQLLLRKSLLLSFYR